MGDAAQPTGLPTRDYGGCAKPCRDDPATALARRPRGRPPASEVPALRDRLLSAGLQLFFEQGYGSTTMSQIVQAAQLSKTTMYARFRSKAEVLRGIVEAQLTSWSADHEAAPIETGLGLEEALRAYGREMMAAGMSYEGREFCRLVHAEAARFPEVAEAAARRLEFGAQYLSGVIIQFAARDGIVCHDARSAALYFQTVLGGWLQIVAMTGVEPDEEAREQWLDRVLRCFLADRPNW